MAPSPGAFPASSPSSVPFHEVAAAMTSRHTCAHYSCLFVALLLLLPVGAAVAQQAFDAKVVGRWAEGPITSVTTDGSIAYVASGATVRIMDFTDPSQPVSLASVTSPSSVTRLVLNRNRLLVETDGDRHAFVDVSTPATPEVLYAISYQRDGIVSGNYLFSADGRGIDVLDLSRGGAPYFTEVARSFFDRPDNLALTGSTLLARVGSTLHLLDATDPASLQPLSQIELAEGTVTLPHPDPTVDGHAYIGIDDTLHVYDLSDASNPTHVAQVAAPAEGTIRHVLIEGDAVYVVTDGHVQTLDVATPASPSETAATEYVMSYPWDAAVSGDLFFAALHRDGLDVVDIAAPSAPALVHTVTAPPTPRHLATADDLVFAVVDTVLYVVDVTDPAAPTAHGPIAVPYTQAMLLRGDRLYIASGEALHILDLSTPSQPSEVGVYHHGDDTGLARLALQDDYAYLMLSGTGITTQLHVVDVSDPTAPARTGLYNTMGGWSGASTIVVNGDVAYFNASGDVTAVDVSDPTNPEWIDRYSNMAAGIVDNSGGRPEMTADHGYLFIPSRDQIDVVDTTDPTALVVRATVELDDDVEAIAVEGDALYAYTRIGFSGPGIVAIDVSDPANPVQAGTLLLDSDVSAGAFAADSTRLYLNGGSDGLFILDVASSLVAVDRPPGTAPASLALEPAFPNPFTRATTLRYDLPEAADVRLTVYDALGREVSVLVDQQQAAGRYAATLDGTSLSTGVYLYHLDAGEHQAAGRVVLVR